MMFFGKMAGVLHQKVKLLKPKELNFLILYIGLVVHPV